jgi:para-aminobenzoate synthetase component 2
MTVNVLVVDNHDSFVFTIVQYLRELGAACEVRTREDVTAAHAQAVDGVLLSPGPGHPADTGICLNLVYESELSGIPLLGVCLGHQVIAHFYGCTVGHAPEIVHGYTSDIQHARAGVFAGLPSPFKATRYHSLAVDPLTVPEALEVTAWTPDGVIMGLRHRAAPIEGVQFHPESILSEHGHALLRTWLATLG